MTTDRTLLFFDTEFTGLTQATSLISLAFVDQTGNAFYAEFSDYNKAQCDQWINDNVLQYCRFIHDNPSPLITREQQTTLVYGDRNWVTQHLTEWLAQYQQITVWGDCFAWDWVLFAELYGGAFGIPKQIFYMPNDLATLFTIKGLDPDTPRDTFSEHSLIRHNALDDARMQKACYERLMTEY